MGTHLRTCWYWCVIFLTGTICLSQEAWAQRAPQEYVLRTYEVGDLLLNVVDRPYSGTLYRAPSAPRGGGSGGGGGLFSVPDDLGAARRRAGGMDLVRRASAGGVPTLTQLCQYGGGGLGGGGGRAVTGGLPRARGASKQPGAASITLDDLIRVLTSAVASESWAVNGVGEGQVEPLGTTLVVWQTPAVHEHIRVLLQQMYDGSSDRKTATIDARWLLLNSSELDKLLADDRAGVPQVDRDTLAEFTQRPGTIRGMTNCFSSQLVYIVSGTRRNVVSSYIPVVGSVDYPERDPQLAAGRRDSPIRFASDRKATSTFSDSKVGYQPIIEKPNLGALLEIRPTLMQGSATAVVDLKSTITVSAERKTRQSESGSWQSTAPTPDRIAIETQEFATTLRVPLGTPVLVGGMTYEPTLVSSKGRASEGGTELAAQERRQLYLVLEVR